MGTMVHNCNFSNQDDHTKFGPAEATKWVLDHLEIKCKTRFENNEKGVGWGAGRGLRGGGACSTNLIKLRPTPWNPQWRREPTPKVVL